METLLNGFTLDIPRGCFPLSTDSMVLSWFARLPKNARVLDLGSGCGTLGVLLCAMVIFINRDQGYGLLRQLCDGCFVAAVLLLGAGVLRYVTNQGAFDVLGYGLQSVFHLHVPGASMEGFLRAWRPALKPGGVIAIALYYGGANGYGERDAVMTWLETLDDRKFSVLRCDWANRRNDPPVPIFIWKE